MSNDENKYASNFLLTLKIAGALYLFVFCLLQIFHIIQVILNSAFFEAPDNIFWNSKESLFNAIAVVSIGPLIEELFFRKLILGIVLRKFPIPLALFISSIFFGLAHIDNYSNPPLEIVGLISARTAVGIGLGTLYLTTGKLIFPVIAHVIYNFLILLPKPKLIYSTGIIDGSYSFLTALPYLFILIGISFYLFNLLRYCLKSKIIFTRIEN